VAATAIRIDLRLTRRTLCNAGGCTPAAAAAASRSTDRSHCASFRAFLVARSRTAGCRYGRTSARPGPCENGVGCRDRTLVADQCGCGRPQAGAVGHYRVPGRDQVCFGQVSQRDRAILQCQHPIAVDAAVREPCVVQAHQRAPGALELVRPRLRSVPRARPGLCVQLPLAQPCHSGRRGTPTRGTCPPPAAPAPRQFA
jgi:hypothetical protein